MRKGLVSLAFALLIPLFAACGAAATPTPSPTTTPLPTPTPTPTFEQKRSDAVHYFKAFNAIDNSLDDTVSQITLPETATSAADLLKFNSAVKLFITALDGAIQRLAELQASAFEPETSSHLQKARTVAQQARNTLDRLQRAISAGDQSQIAEQVRNLDASYSDASAVNRATEQLLLKYNITDGEVGYRFRGQ